MKKLILSLILLVILVVFVNTAYSASGQVALSGSTGGGVWKATKAYAASQIDTILYRRDPSAQSISFAVHFADSAATTNVVIRRVVDGTVSSVLVGDTLTNFTSFDSNTNGDVNSKCFANGISVTNAITLSPMADMYLIIVKYAANEQGASTPTASYEVLEQYSRR
jgi:hypothetical protein